MKLTQTNNYTVLYPMTPVTDTCVKLAQHPAQHFLFSSVPLTKIHLLAQFGGADSVPPLSFSKFDL